MASPVAGSRKVASAAVRGSGSFPARDSIIARAAAPERRRTAIAARPAPEAMAKIVSLPIWVILVLLFHFGTVFWRCAGVNNVVPRMGDVLEKNMAYNAKANRSLCFSVQFLSHC